MDRQSGARGAEKRRIQDVERRGNVPLLDEVPPPAAPGRPKQPGPLELADVVVDPLARQPELGMEFASRCGLPGHGEQPGAQRVQDRVGPARVGNGLEGPRGLGIHRHIVLYGQNYLSICRLRPRCVSARNSWRVAWSLQSERDATPLP